MAKLFGRKVVLDMTRRNFIPVCTELSIDHVGLKLYIVLSMLPALVTTEDHHIIIVLHKIF